jgi:DNA polymerase II large subunit
MAGPTNRDSDKFMLRLPNGMRDRIKFAADKNGRSMNAEIVSTIEAKYPAGDKFSRLMNRMSELYGRFEATEDVKEKEILAKEMSAIRKKTDHFFEIFEDLNDK